MSPARGGASLLTLPFETHHHIFSYLVDSQSSFVPLLLTCKSLYNLVLPLSVHTFRNTKVPKETPNRTRNLKFLRYITIIKPQLAQYVHCLVLGDPQYLHKESGPRPDEVPTWSAYIESAFPGEQEDRITARKEWMDDLNEGTVDAEMALLVTVCTRVSTLLIASTYQSRNLDRILNVAVERAKEQKPGPLSYLKDFYCESTDNKYGLPLDSVTLATIFRLPGIQSYEGVLANGEQSMYISGIPRRSSTIEHIILRRACVTAGMLAGMVGACKSLRSIEYLRGLYHMFDVEVLPREFLDALLPHAETLTSVHVDFEEERDKTAWHEQPEKLFMGTGLRQFTKLSRLVIGSQALTGILDDPPDPFGPVRMPAFVEGAPRIKDCLPESLESLEIHQCGDGILPQVQEFIGVLNENGTQFPRLSIIRLQAKAQRVSTEDWKSLSCNRLSIKLEVIFQSEENRTFDLITHYRGGSSWIQNICTRIYNPEIRATWLKYRGLAEARAGINPGVLSMPDEKVLRL